MRACVRASVSVCLCACQVASVLCSLDFVIVQLGVVARSCAIQLELFGLQEPQCPNQHALAGQSLIYTLQDAVLAHLTLGVMQTGA